MPESHQEIGPRKAPSSAITTALRLGLMGVAAGFAAGFFEAYLLFTFPRTRGLGLPDAGPAIWFVAPLSGMTALGLVGLVLGLALGRMSPSAARRRSMLLALGIAVAAKMMGFDPLSIKFIRLAHEKGLGCGDVREIEIVGEDISAVNFHFNGLSDTFASRGQKLIYWGPLKPLERFLLRTALAPWSYAASFLYHDVYWYNVVGRSRVREALRTDWGRLFSQY